MSASASPVGRGPAVPVSEPATAALKHVDELADSNTEIVAVEVELKIAIPGCVSLALTHPDAVDAKFAITSVSCVAAVLSGRHGLSSESQTSTMWHGMRFARNTPVRAWTSRCRGAMAAHAADEGVHRSRRSAGITSL